MLFTAATTQPTMRESCEAPISFLTLLEYWFVELAHERGLAPDQEQALEEHLFGCDHCTRRLQEVIDLRSGIRPSFQGGALHAAISLPFLNKMKKEGLRVREYRLSPGESVRCAVGATDDAVIGRLRAPFKGVKRLDLIQQGQLAFKLRDIPFNAAAGEVLFCLSVAAQKMPAHTARVRLVATDQSGERTVGDYTLIHAPD